MNARSAHPEHFFAAVEHGLALLAAGAPRALLSTMARGAARRGLADAAAGYDHARLMTIGALADTPASDPGPIDRHVDETSDMTPVDPRALAHYVAACEAAGVRCAASCAADQRALIARVSRLSIPDAVKLLRDGGSR